METLILTLHIIVCVLLVVLILLQAGKEGMGVIFGGGNSSVFGSSGAGGILAKMTAFMAVVFVITCLSYTYVTSPRIAAPKSAVVGVDWVAPAAPATEAAPATPEQPAADTAPEATPAAQDKDATAPAAQQPASAAEKPAPAQGK